MNRHIQNPILVAARGNIVAASDKMYALQREALRIGQLVERGEIQGEDAKKELLAAAEAARICGTDKGREDAANVISKGLAGIMALPDKMAKVAKEAKHDHVGHLDHLARQKPNSYTVVLRGIAEVKPEPVNWLWPGRIALGKVSLIFGEPGIGKSQLSLDIAARVSKGAPWPDRGQAPAGDVVILASEDGIADTVRPRLDVAGADVGRIHFVEAVKGTDGGHLTFDLAAHLRDLEVKMAELAGRTRLVIIDPITSFMGRVDSHKATDVRRVLEPLAGFADRQGVAVLAVSHPTKTKPTRALQAVLGSAAYVGFARAVFLVVEEPDTDRRLFLPVKNSNSKLPEGIGFTLVDVITGSGNDQIESSRLQWSPDPVDMTADDALAASASAALTTASALERAEDWLRNQLSQGPVLTVELQKCAGAAGIAEKTLRRAKENLSVRSQKHGPDGAWQWYLPDAGGGTEGDGNPFED